MPNSKTPKSKISKVWKVLRPRAHEDREDGHIDLDCINEEVVERTSRAILEGQVGILPTETVYGLVGNAQNGDVVERIYQIKGRDAQKALPIQVHGLGDLADLGIEVSGVAQTLAQNFWPGPLTLVLPFRGSAHCRSKIAAPLLEKWARQGTVAVRIPDHPVARLVLRRIGFPIVATSANISGERPVTRLTQLDSALKRRVDWIVDAGPTAFGRESTVVQCDSIGWRILREGALRGSIIQKAFKGLSQN